MDAYFRWENSAFEFMSMHMELHCAGRRLPVLALLHAYAGDSCLPVALNPVSVLQFHAPTFP